ncbi:MAG: phosphoribosylanthranilate isomerase [Verrucomicrobiota bacterium]
MSKLLQVKICGLTNLDDINFALKMGADFLGLILYRKSPRFVSLELARDLVQKIPEGKRVVVDVEPDTTQLVSYQKAGFDYFQIHTGSEIDLSQVQEWSKTVSADRLWLAPKVNPLAPFPTEVLSYAKTILVDTFSLSQAGGTGRTGDWNNFRKLQREYPTNDWILAGGISPDNVTQAIKSSEANFIDVNSGVEEEPGVKSQVKLQKLFACLNRSEATS